MNKELLSTIQNSKNYTLNMANAMPEKLYNFKPADASWNFGELLNHIAYGIQWWNDNYIQQKETPWAPPAMPNDRKHVLTAIENAYAQLEQSVSNAKTDATTVNGVHATLDHITHHRGQAAIYLQMNNVTPPEYTY